MFTVTVGRDASGKSSTRAPLASLYSVTPSIEATLTGSAIAEEPTTKIQPSTSDRRMGIALKVLVIPGL